VFIDDKFKNNWIFRRFSHFICAFLERVMDQFAAMETFVAVVEEGSLSQAARRLNKTPSAVTKIVGALEDELGLRLLERTTRKLVLTEAGRLYLVTANEVLQKWRDGTRRLAELDGTPRGALKVTAAQSFGHAVLAPLTAGFARQYPEIQLEIFLSDRYVDIVGEGFDLALRMGNYELPDQIVKVLGSNRSLLCASPGYLAERGVPHTPEQLAEHACLVFRNPMLSTLWKLARDGREVAIEPRSAIISDNYNLALQAARDGGGIFACPQWSVVADLESGGLVPLLADWQFSSPSFGADKLCAVYPSSRRGSPKVLALIEAVQQRLSEGEARVARVLAGKSPLAPL